MQNPLAQQPEDYVKSAMKVIAANVQAIADEIDYSEVKTLVTGILAAQQNHKRLFVMVPADQDSSLRALPCD